MFYIQRKTDKIKIKEGDLSIMFIINKLELNNVINQVLLKYQTVYPEENMPISFFFNL